jgi:hypothetical protein
MRVNGVARTDSYAVVSASLAVTEGIVSVRGMMFFV